MRLKQLLFCENLHRSAEKYIFNEGKDIAVFKSLENELYKSQLSSRRLWQNSFSSAPYQRMQSNLWWLRYWMTLLVILNERVSRTRMTPSNTAHMQLGEDCACPV